jgi:crotonobetainyl-CoA:carnitine CoA-transferase CaiB-like acyl-CoA transferase
MSSVLEGVKVLDVSCFVSGPWACQLLAEFGADVIKVENPKGGDPFRSLTPDQRGPTFRAHNMHKRSITIDLRTESGAELFRKMAGEADVILENFRPGAMDRLGLGWEDLRKINPRLIYCAISGFGPSGPYARRPAYDTVIQAVSGMLTQVLDPENTKISGPNFADSIAAQAAATGVMGALFAREKTGSGTRIDIPMVDAVISFLTNSIHQYFSTGTTPSPYQRPSQSQCFVLKCQDGKMTSIHLSTPEKFWYALVKLLECPQLAEDPRFKTRADRIKNFHQLDEVLAPIFVTRPRNEWHQLLEQHDIPYAPVNQYEDLADDPQIQHLQTIFTLAGSSENCIARPVIYNGNRQFPAHPAPHLGEHTDQILSELGCSKSQIAEMRNQKII